MLTEQEADIEPTEANAQEEPVLAKGTSARKTFSRLRRELTDDELASPAVQKMLLDEIERLDTELSDEKQFRERFHEVDKNYAALFERFKSKISIEILHVSCIAVGGAALGYATSSWSNQPAAMLSLIFGGVLLVAGLIAKAVRP